ncbi:hypothetical protein [Streptomyces sp. PSAA01]|uniref:hypothetical protein n=1 Tax=Streptomyces sp. PSAA01 TaxID=2912762 RepID=UPI001F4897F2|nr:hypothetical protein [Streptomyces sp. PSAA01]MCG0288514.1 hypothetical protein [Streptomyces sp. PSAA01]
MTFEEEWGRLRADAAERQQDTQMHLNQANSPDNPPLFGPQAPDLASSPEKKKAAVKALGGPDGIEHDTKRAGECVDLTTEEAEKAFKDWDTGAGITAALKGWHASVKALRTRLAAEKTALSETHTALSGTDHRAGALFTSHATENGPLTDTSFRSRVSEY